MAAVRHPSQSLSPETLQAYQRLDIPTQPTHEVILNGPETILVKPIPKNPSGRQAVFSLASPIKGRPVQKVTVGWHDTCSRILKRYVELRWPMDREQTPLGRGAQGSVSVCQDKVLMKKFAIKTAHGSINISSLKNEAQILRKLDCDYPRISPPCFPKLSLFYESEDLDEAYLIQTLFSPTPSFDAYMSLNGARFRLQDMQGVLVPKLLQAVHLLHRADVLHGDLSPKNMAFHRTKQEVVIFDFGHSRVIQPSEKIRSYIQTDPYRAPAVFLGIPFGKEVDMWSIGCLLYEFYTGERLFPVDLRNISCFEPLQGVSLFLQYAIPLIGPPSPEIYKQIDPQMTRMLFWSAERRELLKPLRGTKSQMIQKIENRAAFLNEDEELVELFIELIEQCIQWNPISAEEAIKLRFCSDFCSKESLPPSHSKSEEDSKEHF